VHVQRVPRVGGVPEGEKVEGAAYRHPRVRSSLSPTEQRQSWLLLTFGPYVSDKSTRFETGAFKGAPVQWTR